MKCCKICFTFNHNPMALEDNKLCLFVGRLFRAFDITEEITTQHNFCFECKSLLLKSYTFVNRALSAQKAMEIVKLNKKITKKTWNDIKEQYGLLSALGYHKMDDIICTELSSENEVEIDVKRNLKIEHLLSIYVGAVNQDIENKMYDSHDQVKSLLPKNNNLDSAECCSKNYSENEAEVDVKRNLTIEHLPTIHVGAVNQDIENKIYDSHDQVKSLLPEKNNLDSAECCSNDSKNYEKAIINVSFHESESIEPIEIETVDIKHKNNLSENNKTTEINTSILTDTESNEPKKIETVYVVKDKNNLNEVIGKTVSKDTNDICTDIESELIKTQSAGTSVNMVLNWESGCFEEDQSITSPDTKTQSVGTYVNMVLNWESGCFEEGQSITSPDTNNSFDNNNVEIVEDSELSEPIVILSDSDTDSNDSTISNKFDSSEEYCPKNTQRKAYSNHKKEDKTYENISHMQRKKELAKHSLKKPSITGEDFPSDKVQQPKRKHEWRRGVQISENNIIQYKRKKPTIKPDSDDDNVPIFKPRKTKYKPKIDAEYKPDCSDPSTDSDASIDCYNEHGKRLAHPPREYPRTCEKCEVIVENGSSHYIHYVTFHREEEYPYKLKHAHVCSQCGKSFTHLCKLTDHEKLHSKEKTFLCNYCDKRFYTKKQLISHVGITHKAYKFICDYCGKRFRIKNSIRVHIRTHTGDKPFKCPICGRGYAHSGSVGIHIRLVHQNLKRPTSSVSKKLQKGKRKKGSNTKTRTPNSRAKTPEDFDYFDEHVSLASLKKEKQKNKKRGVTKLIDDDNNARANDISSVDIEENISGNLIHKKIARKNKNKKKDQKSETCSNYK